MCGLGAFIETVNVYRELDVVGSLWSTGRKLIDAVNSIACELGIQDYFQFYGVPCAPSYVTRDKSRQASMEFRTLFLQEMVKNGVLIPWVALCYAHGQRELDLVTEAARRALRVYRDALEQGCDRYLEGRPIKPVFRKFN